MIFLVKKDFPQIAAEKLRRGARIFLNICPKYRVINQQKPAESRSMKASATISAKKIRNPKSEIKSPYPL